MYSIDWQRTAKRVSRRPAADAKLLHDDSHHLLEGTGWALPRLPQRLPDHWTQGDDLADLKEHLRDLHQTFAADDIPGIRKEEELEVA